MADKVSFWYYHSTEYPDEGAVFPFWSQEEAESHAAENKGEMTFGERFATDEEMSMITFGMELVAKIQQVEVDPFDEVMAGYEEDGCLG